MQNIRLLIISNNAISATSNNGKTIRSFLKGIPAENVANLYFGTNETPDIDACKHFYRITEIDILKSFLSFRFRATNSHEILMRQLAVISDNQKLIENKGLRFIKKNSGNLSFIRETLWDFGTWDTKELNEWIKFFSPNAIFAVLGNVVYTHIIARKIAKRFSLPMHTYFTDDYVLNDSSNTWIEHLHFKKIRRVYKKTLAVTDKAFVIGKNMKYAYEEFFHRKFGILVNGINIDQFTELSCKSFNPGEIFIISFIGGIHLNRWKSIVELAKATEKIDYCSFDFRVFCLKEPDKEVIEAFDEVGIRYCGGLNSSQVMDEIANSHCLIHAESFDDKNRIYTKYSISTKIPEYMASKRAIIAIGPSDIASIEIFKNNRIGCVITEIDTENDIIVKLKNLVNNYNSIDFQRQFDFALKNFNQENMLLSKLLK